MTVARKPEIIKCLCYNTVSMLAKASFLFLALFVQEFIALNSLVYATYQGLYSQILVNSLFIVGTLTGIVIGFKVGSYLHTKTNETKVTRYFQKLSERFSLQTKKYRRRFALFLLGGFSFPWVNAIIASYLKMPFWESLFFLFLGNAFQYGTLWLLAFGVGSLTNNIWVGLGIVIFTSILFIVIVRKFRTYF